MMMDAKMQYATDAEVEFVHNYIAKFSNRLSPKHFEAFAALMRFKTKKRLIQFGQYLTIQKYTEKQEQITDQKAAKFLDALNGRDEAITDVTPDCVRWLIGEFATLGETLIRQTMDTYAVMNTDKKC